MAELSNNVKTKGLLQPIHVILSNELKSGIDVVNRRREKLIKFKKTDRRRYRKLLSDEGFNEQECATLLKPLKSNLKKSEMYSLKYTNALACCGDIVLKKSISGFTGKVLDVLVAINKVLRPPFTWFIGDCKFEEKPYRFGLFLDADRFREEVDAKFENVFRWLDKVDEQVCKKRMIIVTNEACAQCQHMLNKLRLGKEPYPIAKQDYIFLTVDSIMKRIMKQGRHYVR